MIFDGQGRRMVPVLSCQGDTEAYVAKSYLEAFGIEAQVNSEIPREVFPLNVSELGESQLLVAEDLADQAKSILRDRLTDIAESSGD